MMHGRLIFIGLGLYDQNDISLKGIELLKQADHVFAEFYTAKLGCFHKERFEKTIGKKITVLSREDTEQGDRIIDAAQHHTVAFLTVGDPMIATTHIELRLRAIKQGLPTQIIHNGSIVTAAPGLLGLQNYKFGRTTTLAYPEKTYFPTSQYTVIKENKAMGLHTLVLLDIQADKQRYMTAHEGLKLLLQMEDTCKEHLFDNESIVCVVARAGAPDCQVAANTIQKLLTMDFGSPLHTLVVPGTLHFMEVEALEACAGLPTTLGNKIQKL